MTDAERQALQTELADLERKLDKRRNEPGYTANAAALKARIADLKREIAEA